MRLFPLIALGTAATALAAAPLLADAHADTHRSKGGDVPQVSLAADELLAPFYARLAADGALPVAPPSPQLAASTRLTRIAFGSCNQQDRSQHMWDLIAGHDPQAFLFIGDNVYGDTNWDGGADLGTLRAAYAKQAAHPEFVRFSAQIPMMATWDDHDFGFNDGGATFSHRRFAETIFETYWRSDADVTGRDGIYMSRMYGEDGARVQLIMLDTRFFRSNLRRPGPGEEGPAIGRYLPSDDPEATMLGAAQWDWLEGELAKPADLRIVVSSIQVLTTAHGWEAWYELPLERQKLLDMLAGRSESGLVMLSGDRHSGGIYELAHGGETMTEITSSSLNLAFSNTAEATAREPDSARVTDFIGEENFGLVDIDWRARELTLTLLGNADQTHAQRKVRW